MDLSTYAAELTAISSERRRYLEKFGDSRFVIADSEQLYFDFRKAIGFANGGYVPEHFAQGGDVRTALSRYTSPRLANVASITIMKRGTGTASPAELLAKA